MKGFLSNLLASILGCFIVLGLIIIIVIASLAGIVVGSEEKYSLKENTVLTLKLDGVLSDRVTPNPLYEFLGQDGVAEIGLDDILSSIKKAKENDKIKGIYINAGALSASGASLKEIRDQLIDFKKSGKFIVAYGGTYTQGAYYVSSVADKIAMNPQGNLDFQGYSSSPVFYKGLLDKLGIRMQIFKVGTFKSAVEPFMLDKMSEANRQQVTSYLNDLWATMTSEISATRNISVAELNLIADSLPLLSKPEMNVERHLIDTLMYEQDVQQYLQTLVGASKKEDMNIASVKNLSSVPFLQKHDSKNVIAILYAEGTITDGVGNDGITNKRYVKELEKLKNDDNVKAVVFRVNSPGGSAYASEQIWKAVSDLKIKKPIVVSMGGVAASGGYYISCNASKIFAEPNTITGSIGIYGMFPDVEGLTNKIGLSYDNVKTNKYADFGDITRPMREGEKVMLQNYIDRGYDLFVTRCSDGRGITKDSINNIAQGRVWTGNQALKIGLVDALGGIDDAIAEAVELAKISDYSTVGYPKKIDFIESFLSNQKEEMTTRAMKEYLGSDYEYIKIMKEIKEQDFIQARLPYDFQVK